ncbi:MAG: hypothetical protein ACTSR3_04495 [Candidatus Helarchaeota archaeon]
MVLYQVKFFEVVNDLKQLDTAINEFLMEKPDLKSIDIKFTACTVGTDRYYQAYLIYTYG